MKITHVLLLYGMASLVSTAVAGPNVGGVLVVHSDPEIVYTTACSGADTISLCSSLISEAPDNGIVNWIVLVAFPESRSGAISTISFGLGDYDAEASYIAYWEACNTNLNPIEIPTDNWPQPGTGTSISWAPSCLSGELIPIYRFQSYVNAPGTIPLAPHPTHGWEEGFVDCDAQQDPILGFGILGLGVPGHNPCPEAAEIVVEGTWGVIEAGD